ncbi:antiviral reverse transcriptase Drt3b [Novosphingobium soli]|uniref:Antiviral reverse transcriptase Drt3b n=1 Tax=Novosphingobium soli TaxID=574956 RepID=A0ABV6CQB1_9SPHN
MSEEVSRRAKSRAILTDTVPYEVPVIFSNDKLFAAFGKNKKSVDPAVQRVIERIQFLGADVTKPYSYRIVKDSRRNTALGIIHPTTQLRMASFYEAFSQPILESCASSEFSLRKPFQETPLFSEAELAGETTFKLGISHIDPADGELDVSHMTSFFSYSKYNLLGKFVESNEFRRLEKRFKYLKIIDVSRCFFNIYTHSISWAIKGKDFSKLNKTSFSFEARFDELMQSANYGETNGIVVGPEISRIFAEIIFQDIDRQVSNSLKPRLNNRDYAVRRYVDDFYIFSNSLSEVDEIVVNIARNLEEYKLFINDSKTVVLSRPFISPISLARTEIGEVISRIYELTDQIVASSDPSIIANKARSLRARADEIRQACGRHNVALNVVSGWVLSNLKNALTKIVRFGETCPKNSSDAFYNCISALLEIIFYVCAVDLRVRTTYTLCQCLSLVPKIQQLALPDVADRVMHFIAEEMSILLRNALVLDPSQSSGVEMSNILITGCHYLGPDFLRSDASRDALSLMNGAKTLTYFSYITQKFCYIKSPAYQSNLSELNLKAIEQLNKNCHLIKSDTELYLLFADVMGCPDLSIIEKSKVYRKVFGGVTPRAILEQAFKAIGFVDWEGTAIQHTLARKSLRPVYSWS